MLTTLMAHITQKLTLKIMEWNHGITSEHLVNTLFQVYGVKAKPLIWALSNYP